jgi:hypothetical protein
MSSLLVRLRALRRVVVVLELGPSVSESEGEALRLAELEIAGSDWLAASEPLGTTLGRF